MESHIGQHISQATEMQPLCWSKTRPSFSGADNLYISWPINTMFVPRIGMYIRINIPKMDFIYLKIWCNSVIFCQRGHFFLLTLYTIAVWICLILYNYFGICCRERNIRSSGHRKFIWSHNIENIGFKSEVCIFTFIPLCHIIITDYIVICALGLMAETIELLQGNSFVNRHVPPCICVSRY